MKLNLDPLRVTGQSIFSAVGTNAGRVPFGRTLMNT
jgi:hypothetical protein